MFYINLNIEIVKPGKNEHAIIHKSIRQSYVSNQKNGREK